MTKEDIGMVWIPGGKHEIEDATLERTAARTLTETIGFKVNETNLRHVETESSRQNKRYVYIAHVQPGSISNTK
jgi:ADP-ribose pyrophosphatase YjhB (NUDIX family)